MSLLQRFKQRKDQDAELERTLGIRKNDPDFDRYGACRYSWADIEDLEWEKFGRAWREIQWKKDNPS